MRYFDFLHTLCQCTSITGTETRDNAKLVAAISPYFDKVETDRLGNILGYLYSKKENAPTLMIDAHFDQIGLMVTDQKEGGFLTFTTVGGVDTRVLPATDVTIHGKEDLFGVISSTPPHLRNPEDTCSSAFSETSLNIRKFMVHILLKPGLENFEHYFTSIDSL